MTDIQHDAQRYEIRGMLLDGTVVSLGTGTITIDDIASILNECATAFHDQSAPARIQVGAAVYNPRAFIGVRFVKAPEVSE